MKRFLTILAIMLVVVVAAFVLGGNYMVGFALSPDPGRARTDSMKQILFTRFPYMEQWYDSVKAEGALRDTFITMPSGERHHALLLKTAAPEKTVEAGSGKHRIAVVVHGYKDNGLKFLYFARMYSKYFGCDVLLPDLHGHGLSEGDDIQMGWNDRMDVLHWIRIAPDLFGVAADSVEMVVEGVSMGAATVMNVSGMADSIPPYVKFFVEDCGYTSAWDEFALQLKEQFNFSTFPILNIASRLCQLRYGWNFGEASPLQSVANCRLPMLFIHGGNDLFVPTEMVYKLYDACPVENKKLWIGEGSAHAYSFHDHEAEYAQQVRSFAAHLLR